MIFLTVDHQKWFVVLMSVFQISYISAAYVDKFQKKCIEQREAYLRAQRMTSPDRVHAKQINTRTYLWYLQHRPDKMNDDERGRLIAYLQQYRKATLSSLPLAVPSAEAVGEPVHNALKHAVCLAPKPIITVTSCTQPLCDETCGGKDVYVYNDGQWQKDHNWFYLHSSLLVKYKRSKDWIYDRLGIEDQYWHLPVAGL